MGSNQQGESRAASEDEQIKDSNFSVVADAKIVSQHCGVPDSNTGTVDEKTREDLSKMRVNAEAREESDTGNVPAGIDDRSVQLEMDHFLSYFREKKLAKRYRSMGYPTPVLCNDMSMRDRYHRRFDKKEFPYTPFLSFGLANFMSYAAHFCKHEARDEVAIVSVGSGNGMVDREIISTYRKHFGEEIKITLVDPSPKHKVDFKTVEDLMEARPEAIGNCILLIIWPESMDKNDGYDIDAVRKLQPRAALVLYDPTGVSGSEEFTDYLRYETREPVDSFREEYDERKIELRNYAVEKVTGLEVHLDAGPEIEGYGPSSPAIPLFCLRLLKVKKLKVPTYLNLPL